MNPEKPVRGESARSAADPADILPGAQAHRGLSAPRAGQAALPPPQAGAINPLSLLRALRRRSALALGLALVLAGVAGPAAWFLVPSSPYRAEARLHIAAQTPQILFSTVDAQNSGNDFYRYQNTQKTLVKSRLVLSAALRDAKVNACRMIREQTDAVGWLSAQLKVEFVGGSEVMEISLSGKDPEDLACIVNAVKQAYMDEVVNVDARRRAKRHEQLKELGEKYTGYLKEKRETMRKLAETVGSNDRQTLALRQQYEMEHLHYLQTELQGVRSQKRKLDAQVTTMGPAGADEAGTPSAPPSGRAIDQLVEKDPDVAALAEQLAKYQQQLDVEWASLQRISRNPTAEPSLARLKRAVKSTQQLLADRKKAVRLQVARQAEEPGGIAVDLEGHDLGRELAMLGELERQLDREIKALSEKNLTATVKTLDLQEHQDQIAQMQRTADKIGGEVEALNVELQAPPRIRPIDEASVPMMRDDKKRYMMIGMVTFGSFFGGLFGVAFLELQTRKVDTAEEVHVELGLPVVGALPMLPARSQHRGLADRRDTEKDRYWRSVLLESVDATRTLLLHAARTGSYRTMMITSAIAGEGKTSLASYLATSLARSGLRTLLIDADLRSPMLHKLFERPQGPGLSELLRGEVDLDAAAGATAVEDLMLLPAGHCDRQALRSLSQGGIAPLFDGLKQRFDFIVVDTSPILPVADSMMVAQNVDAALFSIFSDVSRKTKVKAAVDRLQRLGVPVLGAVVTGTHGGLYGNHYYDPYSSYSRLPESVASTQTSLPS